MSKVIGLCKHIKTNTMKKTISLTTLLFVSTIMYAQCNQTASGFGNNTSTAMYNVQGNVEVILNANNTVTLNTGSNFTTASGPDVRVFLVDRGTLSNTQLKNPVMFMARPKIEMGMLPDNGALPVMGSRSFTKAIPAGLNISNFNTVYLYCQAFNQFWDFGSYVAFNTSNCSVLSSSEFTAIDFSVYPNPVQQEFKIILDNSIELNTLKIYNNLGQIVYSKSSDFGNKYDISSLSKGVYYIEINDESGNRSLKNIIKE